MNPEQFDVSLKQEHDTLAVLFDIDGTLISSGGAGSVAWREAFEDLYGIPADIGKFTDAGMTDPEVGRLTFEAVLGRKPTERELARVLARRQRHLPAAIAQSKDYRVLPGVPERLAWLATAIPPTHRAGWIATFAALQAFCAALFYTWRPLF